ncbi:hypothetical protein KUL118_04630 [Tenacibaculum sp. KUL118]|nr:hypothetical protein KUL118_04630 [Tenacibaculum sp. KUL118]
MQFTVIPLKMCVQKTNIWVALKQRAAFFIYAGCVYGNQQRAISEVLSFYLVWLSANAIYFE